MKLYYAPATCAMAIDILLREIGQPFELIKVDTKQGQTEHGVDYATINEKGVVPVLEFDSGERLTEGPIIAQYVADKFGAEHLMPAPGTLARYRVMEWQNYITSELHKGFTPLFKPQVPDSVKPLFKEFLRSRYEWLDRQLADQPFLTGETFTAADAYLFVVTNWAQFVDLDLGGLDNVAAFQKRVSGRPAVQEAMRAEGLL